ncbi:hypothetical protein HKCCE2091_20870 [Rhodobacterales bacterium HKCCE2091]|nr:hypothetical protein [Rhodobacterales bacterium HKCCE2091]
MPVRPVTRRRARISVTSLIDVIFLLLLFFMLTSTFTRFAELPLSTATGGGALDPSPPAFLQVGMDSLRLNGQDTALAALAEAVASLPGRATTLLVQLSDGVTAQRLVDVLTSVPPGAGLAVRVLE